MNIHAMISIQFITSYYLFRNSPYKALLYNMHIKFITMNVTTKIMTNVLHVLVIHLTVGTYGHTFT
jgi:hypothetical protein